MPDHEAGDWEAIGLHCSMTERRADEATRDVEDWLKCFYMQDKIGEIFSGSIAAVVPFGIFVALDDVFIEGLVHVSELGADYFHYDDAAHAMVGERSGKRYRLSDRVQVQVVRVDLATNKIDFKLAANPVDKIIGSAKGAPEEKRRAGKTPPAKKAAPRARRGKDEVSALPGGIAPVKQGAARRGSTKQDGSGKPAKRAASKKTTAGAIGPKVGRKKKR